MLLTTENWIEQRGQRGSTIKRSDEERGEHETVTCNAAAVWEWKRCC